MSEKTTQQSRRRKPGTEENEDLENQSEDDDKKVKKPKPPRFVGLLAIYNIIIKSLVVSILVSKNCLLQCCW